MLCYWIVQLLLIGGKWAAFTVVSQSLQVAFTMQISQYLLASLLSPMDQHQKGWFIFSHLMSVLSEGVGSVALFVA